MLSEENLAEIERKFMIHNNQFRYIEKNSIIFFESKNGPDFKIVIYQLGRSFYDYRNLFKEKKKSVLLRNLSQKILYSFRISNQKT